MTGDAGPPLFDTPHGRIFFIAAMVCLLAQFLFLVVLDPDRRSERRIYWGGSAAVCACLFFGCLPHWKFAAQTMFVFGILFVFLAFLKTPCIKIGGRIFAARAADRRPDSVADELRRNPTRRNTVRIRWVSAVLVVVFVLAVALWHPAGAQRSPIALPATAGIGAGVGIAVTYADGSGAGGCTAGFLVRTHAGETGLLTAGHCNAPGGPGVVTINYDGDIPYRAIGTVSRSVARDDRHDRDIALVILDPAEQTPVLSTVAGRPITGFTDRVKVGEKLCHLGLHTPTEECGPVVADLGSEVVYDVAGGCGDSGGPVYTIRNGAAVAVALHVAGMNRDGSKPGCGTTHRRALAELVAPWLETWHLTLVTTAAPP